MKNNMKFLATVVASSVVIVTLVACGLFVIPCLATTGLALYEVYWAYGGLL